MDDLILYFVSKFNRILFSDIEKIFKVLSLPPDNNNFPDGEKSIVLTGDVWIFNLWLNPWILFFHNFMVESSEQDAINFPKGLMDISFIEFLWAMNFIGLEPGFSLNNKILPSSLPVITCGL